MKINKQTNYLEIVYLTSNLKWDMHMKYATQKELKNLGLIKYTLLHDTPLKLKLLAYSTLCKPIFEYASEVQGCQHCV